MARSCGWLTAQTAVGALEAFPNLGAQSATPGK